MKLIQKLSMLVAALGIVAVMGPGVAAAHGLNSGHSFQVKASANVNAKGETDRAHVSANSSTYNEYGVHVFGERDNSKPDPKKDDNDDNKDVNRDHHGFGSGDMFRLFYTGTVTGTSSTGFTFSTKTNGTLTVVDTDATIISVPNTAITNANIQVGDRVTVNGMLSGSTLTANFVYDMPVNKAFASDKGVVTAVAGSNLTVQARNGASATVATNYNTQVVNQSNDTATTADVTVGTKVKVFGIWDNILHVLTALKIWIK
jgi:hypothetical protein